VDRGGEGKCRERQVPLVRAGPGGAARGAEQGCLSADLAPAWPGSPTRPSIHLGRSRVVHLIGRGCGLHAQGLRAEEKRWRTRGRGAGQERCGLRRRGFRVRAALGFRGGAVGVAAGAGACLSGAAPRLLQFAVQMHPWLRPRVLARWKASAVRRPLLPPRVAAADSPCKGRRRAHRRQAPPRPS
jgi:hypothetical protein